MCDGHAEGRDDGTDDANVEDVDDNFFLFFKEKPFRELTLILPEL